MKPMGKANVRLLRTALLCLTSLLISLHGYAIHKDENGTFKTTIEADICVYGGSGSGIVAAVAAAREGLSVVVVEPNHEIGGLLKSGFRMQQDTPYGDHLGSLTKAFYLKDLAQPKPRHIQGAGKYNVAALRELVSQYETLIQVITDHRVASAKTLKGEITDAVFEYAPPGRFGIPIAKRASDNLICVKAKVYIDASYEGDLMAYSGVSYRVGKESKREYGESMAGTVLGRQFPDVDPYVEEGKPESGLLSCITPDPLGEEGDASRFFMGYNFKLAWETDPTPEHPGVLVIPPDPKNYDVYELLRRYDKAGYETTWPHENQVRDQLIMCTAG